MPPTTPTTTDTSGPSETTSNTSPDTAPPTGDHDEPTPATEPEVVEELLVEEVSIDGMCGVY